MYMVHLKLFKNKLHYKDVNVVNKKVEIFSLVKLPIHFYSYIYIIIYTKCLPFLCTIRCWITFLTQFSQAF